MEWISTKDKLPEYGQRVLATDGEAYAVIFLDGYQSGDIINEWWEYDCLNLNSFTPTHWQPITPWNT